MFQNWRILVDSRLIKWKAKKLDPLFHANFLEDYPDAKEELDPKFPAPKSAKLDITIFYNADHANEQKTRWSIDGLIALVGRTSVLWLS